MGERSETYDQDLKDAQVAAVQADHAERQARNGRPVGEGDPNDHDARRKNNLDAAK